MASSACTVRPATGSDFPQIAPVFGQENAFHAELLPEYVAAAEPALGLADFNEMLDSKDKLLLVAEREGAVVGVILAVAKAAAAMPFLVEREFVYIMDVAVDEACQGEGVGRALMAEVERWTRTRGLGAIELNVWEANEGAVAFYEELGYEAIDRRMSKRV